MEPAGPARVKRRLAAILAADVAGYSRLMGEDEEGTLAETMTNARGLNPQHPPMRGDPHSPALVHTTRARAARPKSSVDPRSCPSFTVLARA